MRSEGRGLHYEASSPSALRERMSRRVGTGEGVFVVCVRSRPEEYRSPHPSLLPQAQSVDEVLTLLDEADSQKFA